MSKLLIVGASILQLPAIHQAKEMGLQVAVADYNPQAVGIPYADKYYNASTIDTDAICRVAEDFKPDGIMTLATDMPMRPIAAATTKLGLPGISMDTALKSTDKGAMAKAFKDHNVASPWYYLVSVEDDLDHLAPNLTFPCIMKPTDNAGSRGVALVSSMEELRTNYSYSRQQSRGGNVIIEEYLQGSEVSVEVMVVDGKVHILAITDKLTTGAPHFVEMGHSQPAILSISVQKQIVELAENAVKAVGINCGPAHVEMKITERGPVMIELGARMGGDCITTHLVPLSTGIDMIKATIDVALGLKPDITPKFHKGSAIRYFDVPRGVIKSIEGIEDARKKEGVKDIVFTKSVGDIVTDIQSSIDRVGFVIAQGETAQEAVDICKTSIVIKTE